MQILKCLMVAAMLAGLSACSSHKTVSAGGVTVTSDEANKSMTVTTKEGTTTVGKNAVDLAKLGAPVYPGSAQGENGMSLANGTTQMVTLTTADAFDKVYDWYKAQLPSDAEKMKVAAGGTSTVEFVTGGEAKGDIQTTITITSRPGKTDILIVKGAK